MKTRARTKRIWVVVFLVSLLSLPTGTYAHMSASEGILSTYAVRNGRYRWLGDQYPIDYQRLNGNRMPEFLTRARRMCADYGG